jgi:hypothetical protein
VVAVLLDDNLVISVVIAILLDDNIVISIVILLNDHRLLAIAIPLIVARPDCYANRPNADTYLFCDGRHCAANTRYGSNYQCNTNSHCDLLQLLSSSKETPSVTYCSGWVREERYFAERMSAPPRETKSTAGFHTGGAFLM